jgi:competence protein ComEC
MNKSRVFLILSLSFIAGIFGRSVFEINFIFLYFFILAAVIVLAVFYKNKIIAMVSFSIIFFVFGSWLTGNKLEKINNANLDGREISEKVIVVKEPIIKDKYQNVIVKTKDNLKILINANLYADLNYGDEFDLKCLLKIPENKDGEFDYKMYLARDGIFYLCQNADYQKTGKNEGNKIYLAVLNFKNKLSNNINSVIPEPEAALANGLIFGGNSQLSKNVADNFSKTGLSHIVAVSGFNVTIIAEYLMLAGIFLGLWRKQAFWFAIVGIFLFVLSVGFPSSAIRAGVMGSLLLWAMKNGRLANSFNAIIFAAAVMLLLNPLLLRWDIGFQLSFLASLGIIELAPFWEKFVFKKFKFGGIFENILLTLSATVFVLPIIMYNFDTLSIISLLANALILPIIPLAMLLVFLASVVGLVSNLVSLPFAWIAFLPLKYIMETVNYLANLSWSSAKVENFKAWHLMIWYFILFTVVAVIKYHQKKKTNFQ